MKRTALKRAPGPKRKAPLARTRWVYRVPANQSGKQIDAHREWVGLVRERAGNACERCHVTANPAGYAPNGPLDAHHAMSRARGGKDDPENGVLLCRRCHRGAHDHTIPDWRAWLASTPDEARAIRARIDRA